MHFSAESGGSNIEKPHNGRVELLAKQRNFAAMGSLECPYALCYVPPQVSRQENPSLDAAQDHEASWTNEEEGQGDEYTKQKVREIVRVRGEDPTA